MEPPTPGTSAHEEGEYYAAMTDDGRAPRPPTAAAAATTTTTTTSGGPQAPPPRAADELDPVEMMEQDEALALALALSMEPEEPPPSLTSAAAGAPRAQPPPVPVPPPPPYPPPSGAETSGSLLSRLGNMVSSAASRVLGEPRKPDPGDHVRSLMEEWLETEEEAEARETAMAEHRHALVERAARADRQHATAFNCIRVVVPEGPRGPAFEVRTPDGASVRVERASTRGPGSAVLVAYDGEPLTPYDACPFDDEAEPPQNPPPAASAGTEEREQAFLAYYRFRPFEVETQVTIGMGARPLGGCKLVEGDEGVFVASAVVPYAEDDAIGLGHALRAGDLLTSLGGDPVESLAKLREHAAARPLGSKVTVRALRVPGPMVRCPQGHMLRKEWADAAAPLEACLMCKSQFGRHRCAQCAYELCPACFWRVYRSSKVRRPVPVNNAGPLREAKPGADLLFSPVDVGAIVLVFWYSTGEWWVGQIADFDPSRGHTVVYETPAGGVAREVIYDMSLREYRVLADAPLRSPVPGFRRTHMPSVTSAETPHVGGDVVGALGGVSGEGGHGEGEEGSLVEVGGVPAEAPLHDVFAASGDARGGEAEAEATAEAPPPAPQSAECDTVPLSEGDTVPLSEDDMALLEKLRGQLETS